MVACNITGLLKSPTGEILPNTNVQFMRVPLEIVGQDGATITGGTISATSDAAGFMDFSLLPGNYLVTLNFYGEKNTARISVPEEVSQDLADLFDNPLAPLTPTMVAAAIAAKNEAVLNAGVSGANAAIAEAARIAAENYQAAARTLATWAALSALTGAVAGEGAEVLDADAGTHTDPVVGGTVANAGRFTWSVSPAGWQRIGATGLAGKLSLSDFAADTLTRNTSDAEVAIRSMQVADATGAVVPMRAADRGVAWSLDTDSVYQTLGLGRRPIDLLEFSRAGAGDAIGGGASASFADGAPRFHNGVLFLDGGGTNPITTQDVTNGYWTKTGLTTGSATDVAGEAGPTSAKRIPEDTSTGVHTVAKNSGLTIPSSDRCVINAIVRTNRTFLDLDLFNSGTTAGVRGRFDLTGDGAFVNAYPALLGSGASSPLGGVRKLGSGMFHVWVACIFPAATTSIRPTIRLLQSATVTSYTGDAGFYLDVERVWANPGSLVPTSYVETTRAAETLDVALAEGFYLVSVEDEDGKLSSAVEVDFADRYSVAPRANRYEIHSAEARTLPFYDTFTRADTADGAPLGTGETGTPIDLLTWPGTFPMVAATKGQIVGNEFTLVPGPGGASDRTAYAVIDIRDVGGPAWNSFFVDYDFGAAISGAGAISNHTIAIGFCSGSNTDQLINDMPLHLVITRGSTSVQYRQDGETPFPVVGEITHARTVSTPYRTAISRNGDTLIVRTDGFPPIVVQNPALDVDCLFAFFEITSGSDNTTDQAFFSSVGGSNNALETVPAFAVAAPVSHTAAVIGPATAGWVAGKVISVLVPPGYCSNAGPGAITAYLWQYDVAGTWTDLPAPNTASTYQTVDGRDETRVISCLLTVTNTAGSTQMRSGSSAALT